MDQLASLKFTVSTLVKIVSPRLENTAKVNDALAVLNII